MAKPKKKRNETLLAIGGGNATAGGVTFQASVAASVAVQALNATPLDTRVGLGAAKPILIGLETDAPVDDILVGTDADGWVFYQAKNRLQSSASLTSELGKTCDEFARIWIITQTRTGARGWDRPMVQGRDAMVVAVGPATSGTIKVHLARALDALRSGATATMSGEQQAALDSLRTLLTSAMAARGSVLATVEPDYILKFVHVLDFDFGGPHRTAAEAALANTLEQPSTAPAAFMALERACQDLMTARGRGNATKFRSDLASAGVAVKAPPQYRADLAALFAYGEGVKQALSDYQKTTVNGADVTIERGCTTAVATAALSGSLVVVGDPGSGKSAVINEAARRLRDAGHAVALLAVDRLQVETVEGLRDTLGLQNPLLRVLENWPGAGPAYLFLDALDACRFGKSEALFRTFMQDVLNLPGSRWRIVASIRTFDLLVGQEFGRLFRGVPPDPAFVDQRFQTVRHVRIPDWSDTEFAELLAKIPDLKTAIDNGGAKLAHLARVPFNTRLLAELLSLGVSPAAFKNLNSQVQLLEMYWNERVRPVGAPAEQCLKNTTSAMIERGRMEAPRTQAGAGTGTALDELLRVGVFIATDGGREVAFRHHILFDYVASRTLIDFNDIAGTKSILSTAGAGLLLAPAMSFALRHLWENAGADRLRFWSAVTPLMGAADADPISRSVAARSSCDFPENSDDMRGLLALLRGANADEAQKAFRHIMGSLSVRLEDDADVPSEPWCYVAADVAPLVDKLAWPLRQLVGVLIDRVTDEAGRSQLGIAARSLMTYSFVGDGGEHLMPLAISFVGKTFATKPAVSRRLIERLLEPDRMEKHAPAEMHWLAQEVGRIGDVDPHLVVRIYERIFAHKVTDDGKTNLGNSQILGLISNRKQDFEGSRWSLKEAFPAFAASHPLQAAEIALRVAEGYAAGEHHLSEPPDEVTVWIGNESATLQEDLSHIWASEHRTQYADNAQQIVDSFIDQLREAPESEALNSIEQIMASNKLGWLWTRLFMVAVERRGALASRLWPFAAQIEFLSALDTMKDAVDLVARDYANRTTAEREEFEQRVIATTFPKARDPEERRAYFRRKVFTAIGAENLVTSEAVEIARAAAAGGQPTSNERPYRISAASWVADDRGEFEWLREHGADIDSLQNAEVLRLTSVCDAALRNEKSFKAKLSDIESLHIALVSHASALDPKVHSYGWERLTAAVGGATELRGVVTGLPAEQKAAVEAIVAQAIDVASPEATGDNEALSRARENSIRALLNVARADAELTARNKEAIEAFARDGLTNVREVVAQRVGYLWDTDRDLVWTLADYFASEERNSRVLLGLLNFLVRAVNDAPDKVSELGQRLLLRTDVDDGDARKVYHEGLGTLIFHLWVRHKQRSARITIDTWLSNRATNKVELQHGAFSLRSGLVVGYEASDETDNNTRTRAQALAFEIIDTCAKGIESYLALPPDEQTKERQEQASQDAQLLDQMASQFLFAVGATEVREEREPKAVGEKEQQRRYLADNEATFKRVGDVGTPHTIYYMLQLLEFLMPSDPAKVFDLTAHLLLVAGKLHNYQAESLGADQFVRMIGRAIADRKELFDDPDRRMKLVDVLEVFVNAGWPAARRLLYRLPEALR